MKENWKVRKKKTDVEAYFHFLWIEWKKYIQTYILFFFYSSISHVYNNDFEIREIHRNEKKN